MKMYTPFAVFSILLTSWTIELVTSQTPRSRPKKWGKKTTPYPEDHTESEHDQKTTPPSSTQNNDHTSMHDRKMALYMEPGQGSTFIFEIAERDRQCFHEDFYGSHSFVMEYKVLGGGMLDIDASVIGPKGEDIYTGKRKFSDAIQFETSAAHNFSFCFDNTFSKVSKKKIYFSLQAEAHASLSSRLGIRKPTVLTALEASQEEIYEYLSEIIASQKEYRLIEAVDSNYAVALNDHLGWFACVCSAAMVIAGIGQTLVLKFFFTHSLSKTEQKI